jgi:hypothetical protein
VGLTPLTLVISLGTNLIYSGMASVAAAIALRHQQRSAEMVPSLSTTGETERHIRMPKPRGATKPKQTALSSRLLIVTSFDHDMLTCMFFQSRSSGFHVFCPV